ncbi:MAG: SH3 domain-containing protein [Clostridia bacterium]|nr:SH3 domain-containing protein [Clostridia bacterium]
MNLKRRLCTLAISLCLSLSMGVSALAQTGTVTADTLNIRSSTNTSSDIVTKVSYGAELEILASDGAWYRVQLPDGTTGYASAEYLSLNPAYFGVVTATKLIVRSSTSTQSQAITTLPYGSVVELLAYDGLWYKIRYGNGDTGYVSAEYISMDLSLAVSQPYVVYGYISASYLNIRSSTSTDTTIITKLPIGTCVELLAYDGLWYKVRLADGTEGYASAEYISLTPVEIPETYEEYVPTQENDTEPTVSVPVVTEPPTQEQLDLGQAIVQSAYQYLGCPYVWAAEGPDSFDCSGFTMYVMNLHGIYLPHQSGQQYTHGKAVSKDELIPGDLVFFGSSGGSTVAHVGIYIGNGNFIHASSGKAKSVTVSSLSANYYTTNYLGARRVV